MSSNIIQRSSSRPFGNIRVKGSVGDGIEKMMRLQDRGEQFRLLNDSGFPDKTGWLRAGIVSLLLHALLIVFFVFGLNATHTKGGPSIYRVTLRTLSSQQNFSPSPTHESVPTKTQIQEEEYKSMQEIKQKERAFDKKYLGQEIPSPIQRVVTRIPMEKQRQIPQHQEKEEAVERPIPLPIGAVSASNIDLSFETEDDLSIPLPHSGLVEQYQNTIPGTGQGSGQGGSGWGGSGVGSGQGGSGWEGSRKGAGIGQGGSSRAWSGDGSGPGGGGSGWGGSGIGGPGLPHPRYAQNPKPIYPLEAREKRYQGEVLLKVEVLPNGWVGQIEVKKSSGYEVLDQSAFAAVQKWRFIPARKGEVVIPCWVNIPIKFELQ